MLEKSSGVIVNISSGAALVSLPPLLHYASAKAALIAYGKGMATELAPKGIRVNTVTPGNVESPGADAIRGEFAAAYGIDPAAMVAAIPLGRAGVPNDVAEMVFFLSTARSAWITGANFIVDGGQHPGAL
jgi:NAD(P)-dependent dehydrogenase (short-subunit alcohol dehydrogenase family)